MATLESATSLTPTSNVTARPSTPLPPATVRGEVDELNKQEEEHKGEYIVDNNKQEQLVVLEGEEEEKKDEDDDNHVNDNGGDSFSSSYDGNDNGRSGGEGLNMATKAGSNSQEKTNAADDAVPQVDAVGSGGDNGNDNEHQDGEDARDGNSPSSSPEDDDDDDDVDGITAAESSFQQLKNETKTMKRGPKGGRGGGGVRFGSVRVHKHNVTLGDNPSTKGAGPPVMLGWDVEESVRFSNIDEFAIENHGMRDSLVIHEKPHKLSPKCRSKIAALDHSAGSIRKLQSELYEIKKHREQSKEEDVTVALLEEIEEQERQKQKANRKKKGLGGFFNKLFATKK